MVFDSLILYRYLGGTVNKLARWFIAYYLIFGLVVAPLLPFFADPGVVYAETSQTNATPVDQSSLTTPTANSVSEPLLATPPTDSTIAPALTGEASVPNTNLDSTQPIQSGGLTAPNTSALSAGAGPNAPSIQVTSFAFSNTAPKVDENSGALKQRIPIVVPPGRSGVQPDIHLQYSSQTTEDGIFGYGWGIDIPYIERINKTGTNEMYGQQYFYSSLSDELATTTTPNEYRALVERGDFLRYTFSDTANTWTMYDKKGVRYIFGSSDTERLSDASNPSRVFRWMLREVRDTNGNFITYSYSKDDGQLYPLSITYTNTDTQNGIFSINFTKESRPDPYVKYTTGFRVGTAYRVSQVQTQVNGLWARKYTLAYGSGANGVRSMLTSIVESSENDQSVVNTKPPITFEYSNDPVTFQSNWNPELPEVTGPRIATDINGDGLIDVSVSCLSGQTGRVVNNLMVNKGNQVFQSVTPTNPIQETWCYGFPESPSENGVRVMDTNGDFLPDVIRSQRRDNQNGQYFRSIDINNGTYSWNRAPDTWVPLISFTGYNGSVWSISTVGNLNGDAFPDVIQPENGEFGSNTEDTLPGVSLGNGRDWNHKITNLWVPPHKLLQVVGGPTGLWDTGVHLVDVNGDGLDDWVSSLMTRLNDGNGGWIDTGSWRYGTAFNNPNASYDNGIRFVDINGDGLVDILRSYHEPYPMNGATPYYLYPEITTVNEVLINNGSTWVPSTILLPPQYVAEANASQGYFDNFVIKNNYFDVDGDGMTDFSYWKNTARKPDLMTKVTYTEGGSSTVTYKSSAISHENPLLPIVLQTVDQIVHNDGTGNTETHSYSYSDGTYYYGGPLTKKFAGFKNVRETSGSHTITYYYHQGDTSDSSVGEFNDQYAKIGLPFRIDTAQVGNGSIYSKVFTNWATDSLGGGRVFVHPFSRVTESFDGTPSHKDSALEYRYNISDGNLLSKTEKGEVSANATDGTYADTGNDQYSTTYTYTPLNTINNVTLLATELKKDQQNNIVSEARNYYDNGVLGVAVSIGNITKIEKRIDASTFASTTSLYDNVGLVTQSRDENGNPVNYGYDAYRLYPLTSTNAKNQITSYTYAYGIGKPITINNPNHQTTSFTYDGFGRTLSEQVPDPATSGLQVLKTAYTYTDTPLAESVGKTSYLDATTGVDTYFYIDGLGRTIQTKTEEENSNWITKDTAYDTSGRIARESLPYFTSSGARTPETTSSNLLQYYSYDALNRVTAIANAVGTTQTAYGNWVRTVTDPLGHQKAYSTDAYENLIRVDEVNTDGTYTTQYGYNGLRNLLNITDALGNVRNFSYDMLGRQTVAQDLHAPADSTFATYTYRYDLAGNVTRKITPNNQTVDYTYDALNALRIENYITQPTQKITYVYDSCALGVGLWCIASSTGATEKREYTPQGLVKKSTKTILGQQFITQYTYDRQGNIVSIINPDASKITYTYGANGKQKQVTEQESGGSVQQIVADTAYGPHGGQTYQRYTNGTETCYTYDSNKLYRLIGKRTTANGFPCTSVPSPLFNQVSTTTSVTTYVATTTTSYVYATSTQTFMGGAGDGSVYNYATTWADAHDATIGKSAQYTDTIGYTDAGKNSYYMIRRSFLDFDTSAIPDNASVASTTLYLYVHSKKDQLDDGNDFVTVAQGFQATSTSLTINDYSTCGNSISNPTEGVAVSERKDITSTPNARYATWTMNASGNSWINRVGGTKLCMREGHDVGNIAWTGAAQTFDELTFRLFEYVGTGFQPKLDVTYVTATATTTTTLIPTTVSTTTTQNGAPNLLQDLSYSYDAAGNMTTLTESAPTILNHSNSYTYDNLNRLLSSTINSASSTPFTQTFSYNPLGNLLSMGSTTYAYAGTGYANPHAPTAVGVTALTYDNSGNLVTTASTTNAWDYHNRLLNTSIGSNITSYDYDYAGSRALMTTGGMSTLYPTTSFTKETATTTKHIFFNDIPLATVIGTGTTTLQYIATDHLGGTNIVSDSAGIISEALDYMPYGSSRIDSKTTANESRKFIGQYFDDATQLSYLNARYYDGSRGQFLSEDPTFLVIGDPQKLKNFTGTDQLTALSDPQTLNSYSYGRDNPITKSDPTGLWYKEFITGQQSWPNFSAEINDAAVYLPQVSSTWGTALDHPYRTGAVIGLFAAPIADAALTSTVAITSLKAGVGAAFLAGRLAQSAAYGLLAGSSALGIPSAINTVGSINNKNPSAAFDTARTFTLEIAPTLSGNKIGGFSDVVNLLNQEVHALTQAVNAIRSVQSQSNAGKKK